MDFLMWTRDWVEVLKDIHYSSIVGPTRRTMEIVRKYCIINTIVHLWVNLGVNEQLVVSRWD